MNNFKEKTDKLTIQTCLLLKIQLLQLLLLMKRICSELVFQLDKEKNDIHKIKIKIKFMKGKRKNINKKNIYFQN